MATNWITLTANNLAEVLAIEVLTKSNENIDADSLAARLVDPARRAAFDPDLDNRAASLIQISIDQIRAAIRLDNKVPLSCTANTIPPEARRHALYLAAYALVNATLNLQSMLFAEQGRSTSVLEDNFKRACDYLDAVSKGKPVTPPDDPTGEDYVNPINMPWYGATEENPYPAYDAEKPVNKPVSPVRFGAHSPNVALTTTDSLFTALAPYDFPSGNIGQP